MPIYEFTCKKCSSTFTKRAKIADKDHIKCPECSSKEIKENFTTEIKTKSSENANSACNFLFKRRLSGG